MQTGTVRKAVIPAAGFGTRLFPATRVVQKALLPVPDGRGGLAPAVQMIAEEALAGGVETVIIVVRAEDLPAFRALFHEPLPGDLLSRLPAAGQESARRLLDIGRHVELVVQPRQDGLGDAVYCARETVGGEPFLLLLGDRVYRSRTRTPCARQLVDAFTRGGCSAVSLYPVPAAEVERRGLAAGRWLEPGRLIEVSAFAEKPTPQVARERLRMPGLPRDGFLALFGQYVLEPQIFHYLEESIAAGARERGEFQITTALDRLCAERGCLGLLVEGDSYDIGSVEGYLHTLQVLGSRHHRE